jgi:hypothetical protein
LTSCRLGSGASAAELAERFGAPVIALQAALSDLASGLPPHSSRSVSLSLVRKRPWLWFSFAVAGILIAVGIYFILTASDALKALSGAGLSVLSAVGITAASIKRSATEVGDRLISEVWSAELDWAIADAVTVGPTGWRVKLRKVEMPPRGPGRAPPRKKLASS